MDVNGRRILCLSSVGLILVLTSIIVSGFSGGGNDEGGGNEGGIREEGNPGGGIRGGSLYVSSYCIRGGICKGLRTELNVLFRSEGCA